MKKGSAAPVRARTMMFMMMAVVIAYNLCLFEGDGETKEQDRTNKFQPASAR